MAWEWETRHLQSPLHSSGQTVNCVPTLLWLENILDTNAPQKGMDTASTQCPRFRWKLAAQIAQTLRECIAWLLQIQRHTRQHCCTTVTSTRSTILQVQTRLLEYLKSTPRFAILSEEFTKPAKWYAGEITSSTAMHKTALSSGAKLPAAIEILGLLRNKETANPLHETNRFVNYCTIRHNGDQDRQ